MLTFPLIRRELQVQSRKRGTYLSRLIYGLLALGFLALFFSGSPRLINNGAAVLSAIHGAIALMLAITAPIGTCDAISKEKRDGTLGLLMLTPISPGQVALGKFSAHLLRIFYFLLTMLPFLAIPMLIGGVSGADFAISAAVLFSIGLAGASAGMWASATCARFAPALFSALIIAVIAMWFVPTVVCNIVLEFAPPIWAGDMPAFVRYVLIGPALLMFPVQARQINFGVVVPPWFFPAIAIGLVVIAFFVFMLSWGICARRIARHGAAAIETKRRAAFRRRFLTPVLLKSTFRRTMSRSLDRNPLIWLEYRTAWARSARWAILLTIVIIETWLLTNHTSRNEFSDFQFAMLCGLLGFMTFKSCGSFQREKESGAFELLLVTPLTERKLYTGRLRAVASYFGPALLLLGALWPLGVTRLLDWGYHRPWDPIDWIVCANIFSAFFSAPALGLYFALRCRTFLPALLWTSGLAIAAPIIFWAIFEGLVSYLHEHDWWIAYYLNDAIENLRWQWVAAALLYHVTIISRASQATLRLLQRRDFVARG